MKKLRVLAVALAIMLTLPLAACNMDTPKLVKKTKYGLVELVCYDDIGSGVITQISEEGCIIVTNYHIVKDWQSSENSPQLQVRFYESSTFEPAELLGYSSDYDIAALKTKAVPKKGYAFKFGKEPKVGDTAVSLGFVNSEISAYEGIVSCRDMLVDTGEDFGYLYLTQVSTPSPWGYSGGVTVNPKGKIMGLNAFNFILEDLIAGISYKVPVSIIKAVYNRILNSEKDGVYQPALGFVILPNGEILVNCLNNVKVLYEYGKIKVISSDDEKLQTGKEITHVNGKKANLMTFLSEIITTYDKTEFTQSE